MMAMTPQMAGMEDDSKWKGNQSVFQILLIFLDSLAHGFLGSGSGGTRRRRSPVERGESVRPSVRPSIRPSVHLPPRPLRGWPRPLRGGPRSLRASPPCSGLASERSGSAYEGLGRGEGTDGRRDGWTDGCADSFYCIFEKNIKNNWVFENIWSKISNT